jgi:alpha-glucosidase
MVNIHVNLKPYLKILNAENATSGVPFMRNLYTHYPSQETKNIQDEFLLGPDLLISPVLKPDEKVHEVFLPEDEWIYLWDETLFKGGKHLIASPMGAPPVFIRKTSNNKNILLKIKEGKE